MKLTVVDPPSWAKPQGYANGVRGAGEMLFVAGQVGWDAQGKLVSPDLVAQFAQALDNVLEVVWHAGGKAENLARLTVYVTDKDDYVRCRKELGRVWRERMGRHYPAMSLVEVRALLEEGAKVEIEATALL